MEEKPKRAPRKKPAAKRPGGKPKRAAPAAQAPPAEPAPPAEQAPPVEQAPAVEEPTAVLPPAEEPTDVLPPAEVPTSVMPPATAPPSADLPPAAAPAGYAPLSATAVVAGPSESRSIPWAILAIAFAAIAFVVLMWALVGGGSGAEAFTGTWARTAGLGGGLVVAQEGDDVTVTWYDGQLNAQGPLSASVDGDVLTFELPDVDGSGARDASLATTDDADVLQLTVAGAAELVTRTQALTPATGAPSPAPDSSPAPTVAPSPTPSASGSPSPSPSTSGSPSPSPSASGTDQDVISATLALNAAILQWAATHGNVFPAAGDVSATGAVGQSMSAWPANPFTGQPMKVGNQPGDYAYEQLPEGQNYKLTAYLANGYTYPAH